MTRVAWDRAAAVVLLVLAAYVMAKAHALGFTQRGLPGPGFAPFWIGAALAIAAIAVLAESRGRIPRTDPAVGASGTAVWWPAAVTVAAVALIPRVGMLVALGLMLLAQVRYLGGTWRTSALAAVALPAALYIVFGVWLRVPVPHGPWGF